MPDETSLDRFVEAQTLAYPTALAETRRGAARGSIVHRLLAVAAQAIGMNHITLDRPRPDDRDLNDKIVKVRGAISGIADAERLADRVVDAPGTPVQGIMEIVTSRHPANRRTAATRVINFRQKKGLPFSETRSHPHASRSEALGRPVVARQLFSDRDKADQEVIA